MKLFFHYCVSGFSNTYLVGGEDSGDAIIVDPGTMDANLLNNIERNGYYVKAVLLTHSHRTHVNGIKTLLKIYSAEVYASTAEVEGQRCTILRDGDRLSICGFDIEVLSVPGHSSDSVAYKIENLLFVGDTLTSGLLGETPGSFGKSQLLNSLRSKILSQKDECLVLPGHGPPSTIGTERLYNLGLKESNEVFPRQPGFEACP